MIVSKWIIIITFAVNVNGSTTPKDLMYFARTPFAEVPVYSQPVTDTKGRIVWFDDKDLCEKVGSDVVDRMLMEGKNPLHKHCIRANVEVK